MPFREIVGHRRLLTLLSQAIARESLTPSLILSGPAGVGKRLAALAVAQGLNCASPISSREDDEGAMGGLIFDACGDCSGCRRVTRGIHPDVQIIEPGETGSIKIEQVRAAIDRAVFRPFEGRRRVTIIDHADALVLAAQHALLKTLEEPLPASVFILVTSRPDALLATVRSRCARLRFGRLAVADVAAVLERSHQYTRTNALAVAAASDGSLQRALELQAGSFAEARTDAEALLQQVGRGDARQRLERTKELLKGGGSASAEREHLGIRLQALVSVLRDVGLLISGADARLLANLDRRSALDVMARRLGSDRVSRAFTVVTRAYDALERNVSPKVVADWLAIQL
jgi:DNA polymerase-3 subunit delta'